jgi:predicted GNAT family acetyltransferase
MYAQRAGCAVKSMPEFVVNALTNDDEGEVLEFLSRRPTRAFGMTGLIKNNGLMSPFNRGRFYACRDKRGKLHGVGLVGYNTLVEARTEAAIRVFADLARAYPHTFLVLGEEGRTRMFWDFYNEQARIDATLERFSLLQQTQAVKVGTLRNLRRASLADLDLVVEAHNQIGIEQTGVNGLERDRAGFIHRCQTRIEREQTWVLTERGKLVFKTEVLTDTPEVSYIESIWVHPAKRNKGYALTCLTQLTGHLLKTTASVCLLVKESNTAAQSLYKRAGFKAIGNYLAIFLNAGQADDPSR